MKLSQTLSGEVYSNTVKLTAAAFLLRAAFQATYFVGVIGSATYLLDANAFMVSSIVFVINIALVVSGGLAGVIIDRVGPQRMLIITSTVIAVVGALSALLPLSYVTILLMAALFGLSGGANGAALNVYPRFLTSSADQLKVINSFINTMMCVTVIVGPMIGGQLGAAFGNQVVFWTMPVCGLPALVIASKTRELITKDEALAKEHKEKESNKGGFWTELAEGIKYTFTHETIMVIFAMYCMAFFSYGAFDSLESLFYRDVLRVGVDWMGWLSAAAGIGATVGSLSVLKIPTSQLRVRLIALLLLITGVGTVIYVGTNNMYFALVGQIITGLGFGAIGPVESTLIQNTCDVAYIGRVNSFINIGINVVGTLPLIIAPFIANVAGVQATLIGAAALVVVIGAAFFMYTGKKNQ